MISTAVHQRTTPQGRLKLVLVIGGLSMFGPLSMDLYLPALPSLSQDLGGSPSLVQLTLTACLLGLAAGQLVAGPLSDALGRRGPLLVGVATYALASLLCALAPSVPVLIVCRLIQGLGGAAGVVIARAVVRDVYAGSAVARFLALTMPCRVRCPRPVASRGGAPPRSGATIGARGPVSCRGRYAHPPGGAGGWRCYSRT